MGRTAYGVKGIELERGRRGREPRGGPARAAPSSPSPRNGYGKRTALDEYRLQSRGGKGLINIKTSERNGPVVGVNFLRGEEQVMLITEKGMIIRLNTADISTIGRNTQGVRLIQLEEGDHLVSVARLAEREEDDESLGDPTGGGPGASRRSHEGASNSTCGGAGPGGRRASPAAAPRRTSSTSTSVPSGPTTRDAHQLRHGRLRPEGGRLEDRRGRAGDEDAGHAARPRQEGSRTLEAQQKANKKEYRAWGNDLAVYPKLDQVRDAASEGRQDPGRPAGRPRTSGTTFKEKDRELKKAVADAKAAVEQEKRNVALSVGQIDDIETLTGEVIIEGRRPQPDDRRPGRSPT